MGMAKAETGKLIQAYNKGSQYPTVESSPMPLKICMGRVLELVLESDIEARYSNMGFRKPS